MTTQEQNWKAFEALKDVSGTSYIDLRNSILTNTPNINDRLQPYLTSDNWQDNVNAKVIAAWKEHQPLYETALARLDNVDVNSMSRTALGMNQIYNEFAVNAHTKWHTSILPLCWEFIMKSHGTSESWKTTTFLRTIKTVPDKGSIDPLLSFMTDSNDEVLQRYALEILESLPPNNVKPRIPLFIKSTKNAYAIDLLSDLL